MAQTSHRFIGFVLIIAAVIVAVPFVGGLLGLVQYLAQDGTAEVARITVWRILWVALPAVGSALLLTYGVHLYRKGVREGEPPHH